ncbi:hypothetical protein C8Q76DRAFT_395472 [Earliella scabrosa]|nr:hypothetical protein C8Q76DRAFT_395472 [Earliella scabrosa]
MASMPEPPTKKRKTFAPPSTNQLPRPSVSAEHITHELTQGNVIAVVSNEEGVSDVVNNRLWCHVVS